MKFEILSLDVWGNEEDGFEINQVFATGNFIDIDDNDTNLEILIKLVDADILYEASIKELEVDWQDENYISVSCRKSGRAELALQAPQ